MSNILNSASKIVFLVLTISACIALFVGKIESKDFMVLAMAAYAFYFAKPVTGTPLVEGVK